MKNTINSLSPFMLILLLYGMFAGCKKEKDDDETIVLSGWPHGLKGTIAFSYQYVGSGAAGVIWTADSTGFKELSRARDYVDCIRWSPDKEKIAYSRNGKIYTMMPDGSNITLIRSDSGSCQYFHLDWSPDGKKIAIGGYDVSLTSPEIYVMNADGTELFKLTPGEYPIWSPDGKNIIFLNSSGTWSIDLSDHSTTKLSDFANPILTTITIDISPDGTKFVLGGSRISVMNLDGSSEKLLTPSDQVCFSPCWSPDGTKIAYWRTNNWEFNYLCIMDADGSNKIIVDRTPYTTNSSDCK